MKGVNKVTPQLKVKHFLHLLISLLCEEQFFFQENTHTHTHTHTQNKNKKSVKN